VAKGKAVVKGAKKAAELLSGVADDAQKLLTEAEFYKQYVAHKDIRNKGANAEQIMRDGWMPGIGTSALPPYRGGNPSNVIEKTYGPKAGDTYYLVPKGSWTDGKNGLVINAGWKPKPNEIVKIENDNEPLYNAYLRSMETKPSELLGATAATVGAGMVAADPQYQQDAMEAYGAAQGFAQRRQQKAGYWAQRRQEVIDLANSVGDFTSNTVFPSLDKPLQGYMGLAGVAGSLVQGNGLQNALQQGGMVARQPTDQTAYQYGGAMTDTLTPYLPAPVAAGAGALTNAGVLLGSPL